MSERSDQLGDQAEHERGGREHRTALAAAFRDAANHGAGDHPALARLVKSRVDGTTIPTQKENDR